MSGYSGRYAGRVDMSFLESPNYQQQSELSGDDSPLLHVGPATGTAPRRSRQQLQHLADQLSDRDRNFLDTVRRFRLATTDQLQRQLFTDHASVDSARRVTRRTLTRLNNHGLIRRLGRRIGGIKSGSTGMVWSLTPHGHRLLGATKRNRLHEPSPRHIRHVLAITELATALTEHARNHNLGLVIETEPDCWRQLADHRPPLKPDLYVTIADDGDELLWFIEIDRSTESGTVIGRKLSSYHRYWQTGNEQRHLGTFPKVLWITPDQKRADFINQLIKQSTAEPTLFATTSAGQALDTLTDFSEPAPLGDNEDKQ